MRYKSMFKLNKVDLAQRSYRIHFTYVIKFLPLPVLHLLKSVLSNLDNFTHMPCVCMLTKIPYVSSSNLYKPQARDTF